MCSPATESKVKKLNSSEIQQNQGFLATWGYSSAGRALEWHSRGQRFDPAYLHQKHSISLEIECFSILFSLFCTGRFHLGQQIDNRPSQFLLFLLREGRSYGICQRRNNHAGLPFPGSPAFFYSRCFFSFFMWSMASCREAAFAGSGSVQTAADMLY